MDEGKKEKEKIGGNKWNVSNGYKIEQKKEHH